VLLVIKLMPYIVIAGLVRWMAADTRRVRLQAGQAASTDPAPVLAQR